MNSKLFASMQDQMVPSAEVIDGLKQQLTSAAPAKKRRPVGAYAVVAACAALALLIYPVSRMAGAGQGQSGKLHSYVTVDSASAGVASGQQTMTGGVEAGGSGSYSGDPDAAVHAGDPPAATSNAPVDPGSMLDPADYTGETIPGGAMIETPIPITPDTVLEGPGGQAYQNLMSYFAAEYGKDVCPDWYGGAYLQGSMLIVCVVDANVPAEYLIDAGGDMIPGKEFYLQIQNWADSTSVGFASTLPGGAMIEAPTPISPDAALEGPAAEAYQNLMSYFTAEYGKDAYPGWYGGAYLQGSTLIVCVVDANVPAEYMIDAGGDMIPGKEFYLQIQKWADSTSIGYSSAKYSMSYLRDLQRQITELPELKALTSWGCGANDMTNQVELDVPEVNDALLAALARLDPDDDAILVRLGTVSLDVTVGTFAAAD